MANPQSVELHALGAEASAGSGPAVDIGSQRTALRLALTVTTVVQAIVKVQTSPDGTTGWRDVGTFSASKVAQGVAMCFHGCDRYVRASWSAAITFSLAGDAQVLYAKKQDVLGVIKADAVAECTEHEWADALITATDEADVFISNANPDPLTVWRSVVTKHTAEIAAWSLLSGRGIDADDTADMVVKGKYDTAMKWFEWVSQGKLKPPGMTPPDNLGIRTAPADDGASLSGDCVSPGYFTRFGDFG